MIEAWEHRKLDRAYLSLPIERGARYRVKGQGSKWLAQRIGWGSQPLGSLYVHHFIGSFDSPRAAMRACQARDAESSPTTTDERAT